MDARRAVFLNLDADVELAMGAGYTPTQRVLSAMRPHVAALARGLLRDGDVLIDDSTTRGSAAPLPGLAFCPTPRAIAMLRRAGAEPLPYPSFDVLRRVNSRAFTASLGQTMDGAVLVTDVASAISRLAEPPPLSDAWRVKRAFGMAGRGQRVVAHGTLDAAGRSFVEASIARDGAMQIEPNVRILTELGLHGLLAGDGAFSTGMLVRQRCDAHGAWVATEPLPEDDPARVHEPTLRAELARIAAALHAASYFGPFGLDAFTYLGPDDRALLQPRSEVNARFSMGWPAGMGPA